MIIIYVLIKLFRSLPLKKLKLNAAFLKAGLMDEIPAGQYPSRTLSPPGHYPRPDIIPLVAKCCVIIFTDPDITCYIGAHFII